MRIAMFCCLMACVLAGASQKQLTAQPKYGVTVRTVNRGALLNAKTYEWTEGQPTTVIV